MESITYPISWLFVPFTIFVANSVRTLLQSESQAAEAGASFEDAFGEGKPEMDKPSGEYDWKPAIWDWTAWAGSTLLRAGLRRVSSFIRARRTAPSAPGPDDEPRPVIIDMERDDLEEIELGPIPEPRSPTPTEADENSSGISWWQLLTKWWWALMVVLVVLVVFACG